MYLRKLVWEVGVYVGSGLRIFYLGEEFELVEFSFLCVIFSNFMLFFCEREVFGVYGVVVFYILWLLK